MGRLDGRVVVVTGAARGIGRGVALRLAQEGAALFICDLAQDGIESVAGEIRKRGGVAHSSVCDVTRKDQVEAFLASASTETGRIDALVNNAAYIAHPAAFDTYTDDDYDKSIAGGLTSVFYMMRAALPFMRERGGRIVNITSIGGLRGVKGSAAYAAAKTGVIGLTRTAANEWGCYGITVNCIAPMAMTEAWAAYMQTLPPGTDPWAALNVRSNALGYVGDPEADIAPAVAFLCSDDARYVTGAVLPVDGGLLDVE